MPSAHRQSGASAASARLLDLQLVAQAAGGGDGHIGADAGQLFPQKADVDLHIVFHGIGIIAPDLGQNHFLGDTLTCRLNLLPNETDEPVYHYLHTIARNDAETAAQVYSEWIPRSEQIDVSVHAPRK